MRQLLVCVWALLAGCSDLRDLGEPVCGNGLIEPGEDCDSPMEHCDRCSIVCAASADCNAITGGGYVCGPDQRCHAPAGTFAPTPPVHMNVDAVRISDVSQPADGFGDLLAKSSSAVTVVYGAADGLSASRVTVQAPTSQGPVTFAQLDGDPTPDLMIPTPDGIAAFTFGFGTPAPYTWPQLLEGGMGGGPGQPLMAFEIDNEHVAAVGNMPGVGLGIVVLYVAGGGQDVVAAAPLCNAQVADFSEGRTAIAFAPSTFPGTHVLFAAALGSGAASTGCVVAIDSTGSLMMPFAITEVAQQTGFDPSSKPTFAPLDGEANCPSLIAQPAVGQNLLRFPGVSTGGASKPCRLGTSVPLVRKNTMGQILTTGAPLGTAALGNPALGPVDHAVVLTNGVFVYRPGAFGELAQVYSSDRVLDRTAAADLDGDGLKDLVAIGSSQSDLDLLYQISPSPGLYTFLRVRLPTAAPVSRMLLGDFDGSGRVDIAYVERADAIDRLMIAYGTADRPLEGQLAGSFTNVFSVLAVTIPDSNDPYSVIDDLAVLYTSAAGEQLALLHGSPQRTMQAYYDPFQIESQGQRTTLAATVPGAFGGGRGGHDLMSLGTVPDPSNPNFTPVGVMYVTPTSPDGALAMSGGRCAVATGLMECEGIAGNIDPTTGGLVQLCLSSSAYTAWSVGDHDVVIGVDGRGHAVTIDSSRLGVCNAQIFPPTLTLPSWGDKLNLSAAGKPRRVRSLQPFGTDAPELGVVFEPGVGQPASFAAVRTCELETGATTATCSDPTTLVAEYEGNDGIVCTDLASGHAFPRSRFDDTPPPIKHDLFVVCGGGDARAVYRISRFSDRSTTTRLFDIGTANDIEVGDINGDAIDDIVVIDHGAGGAGASVTVHLQCTSRTAADCLQLSTQPEEGTK